MAADLIILFGENHGSVWQWGLTSDGKAGLAETDQQKSVLGTLNFKRLMVVLPGQQVVIKLHTLGTLNDKQKRQAAGFSIEDELASPLENNHISLDANSDRLGVVSSLVMENVISELAKYGLSADIICADYDSLSDAESFVYQDRIIQRSGNGLGYSAETNLADALLDKGQAIPQQIDSQEFLQKISAALQSGHIPINLRQGIFAKRGKIGVQKFKRSLGLAATVVVVFAGANILQGASALRKTQDLQEQMAGIYTQIFPNQAVPENPALAVMRAQADAKAANNQWFIELSALLATSARKVSGVEVSSLRYDAARQQLNLSIRYSGFDDVEALKQAVASYGGIFTESGTRQSGDALLGDAILRLGQ
ncbi:MAG: hypothetical protein COA91_02925 [Robiginitomaculum sp.]|nr:MAG: hypothetical protein COA91_02925 [Robiginitomaculum sp.]